MPEKILLVLDPSGDDPDGPPTEAELVMNTSLANRGFDYEITYYQSPIDYYYGEFRNTLPSNYLEYDQIWYTIMTSSPIYTGDLDKLVDFVIGEGKTVLILGEWSGYFDNDKQLTLSRVFEGVTGKTFYLGPSLYPTELKPKTDGTANWYIMVPELNTEALENLDQNPIQLTSLSYASAAIGTMRIYNSRNGLFVYNSTIGYEGGGYDEEPTTGWGDSPYGAITIWPEADTQTKKGRLAIIMDYNWLTPGASYLNVNKDVIWSLVYFLSKARRGGVNVTPALRLNQRDDQQGLSPTARLELSASNSYQTNNSSRIFGGMYL